MTQMIRDDHPADVAFMAGIDDQPGADPAITPARLARLFARPLDQVRHHHEHYRALLLGRIGVEDFTRLTGDVPDPEIHYEATDPELCGVLVECIDGHHGRCPAEAVWLNRRCQCDCHTDQAL